MWPRQNKILKNKFSRHGKKNYSLKKYSNPFFQKKKKNKFIYQTSPVIGLKIKLSLLTILGVLIAGIWLLLYSSYFDIKNIQTSGQGRLPAQNITKIAWEQINNSWFKVWPQKNIFLFNKKKLKDSLMDKYAFNSIIIKKKLPKTLIINYKEKKYVLIWQDADQYYYADKSGYVIEKTDTAEIAGKNYPIIENKTKETIKDNQLPASQGLIDYILDLFNKFKQKNEFNIKKYVIGAEPNTVIALIDNGPKIYFNIRENADKQLKKLEIIKNEKIKKDFNKKTYIDLRFGDRVYYQ